MTIEKHIEGNNVYFSLTGRLDSNTSHELETALKEALDEGDVLNIIFVVNELEYISSAGLRVVLMAKKSIPEEGEVKIIGANDDLMEIFEVTGFNEILTIE